MEKFDPNESIAEPVRYFYSWFFTFDVLEEEIIEN